MFRIHNFEELKLMLELLKTFEHEDVRFPVDLFRNAKRVSAFQSCSDLECYTYVDGKRAVMLEAAEGTTDRRVARARDELVYERSVGNTDRSKTCHDCRAEEGAIHEYGCDMENCPFCGHQLISCGCIYDHLGYEQDASDEYGGLGEYVYNNGPSTAEEDKFLNILEEKGRIPYIIYPVICGKCGKLWPEFFKVSTEEWEHYIAPIMRREVICQDCYDEIKVMIDLQDMQVVA